MRRVTFSGLYEKGYPWDGSCRCGANDWERHLWEHGYSNHCCVCGWHECTHPLKGVSHTSDGVWVPLPGARHVSAPSGCPILTESPVRELECPSAGRSV